MLEKPDISDEKITACLQDNYGLTVAGLEFLPLGADVDTSVFRADAQDGAAYFVKLRRGFFDDMTVAIPSLLSEWGINEVIPPLATLQAALWVELDEYKLILYPFINGQNGYRAMLSEVQWQAFGAALRRIHDSALPAHIAGRLQVESFSSQWRDLLKLYLEQLGNENTGDGLSRRLVDFLRAHTHDCADLIGRAERLALALQASSANFVLCHSDVHAGNLVVADGGRLYIVDWDNPILAPRERDLMFIANAQGFVGYTPEQEERLFYRGYGQVQADANALAYYRYERIIVDLALFCQQIFDENSGREDRQQGLKYLISNFLPGNTIELAYRADRTSRAG